jgi:hypothetical protein
VTSAFTVDTYQSMVHATIKHTNYPILHLRLSPTDPLSHPISYPLFFSRKRKRTARKYIKKKIKVQKDPKIHGTKKAALRRPITSINETIHDKNTATKTALQLSS